MARHWSGTVGHSPVLNIDSMSDTIDPRSGSAPLADVNTSPLDPPASSSKSGGPVSSFASLSTP